MWTDRRLLELIDIELPIIQAPMAGASGSAMAIAVCKAGGLGSLPCAMLDVGRVRAEIGVIREQTSAPLNMNFFCHSPHVPDVERDAVWKRRLALYYAELDVETTDSPRAGRAPFDDGMCEIVEDQKPAVVSFHFGLPDQRFVDRVKSAGCLVLASATTVTEARWLESKGCDAIIAQGYEAGGHRGMFLTQDTTTQPGTFALVPQVVDAVSVPVIAAGGIADGRGVAAAFALGAAGVQMGTAYLFTPESLITDLHRTALRTARDDQTALTNVFSGRPARGLMNRVMREVGPMTDQAPSFPTAGIALAPLRAKNELAGRTDFSPLWSGQAAGLNREAGAAELTRQVAADALKWLDDLSGEHKLIEATHHQSKKMEAVGRLTGDIAHEFNNVLGIISGNLHLLKQQVADDEALMDRLAVTESATERAVELTRQLLEFSCQPATDSVVSDINQVALDMGAMINASDITGAEAGGAEMILVVDDEIALVELAKASLEMRGYRVVTATSGMQALELLKEDLAISLLFSDVIMPGGMNGYELAEQAIKIRPDLKILLTSGDVWKQQAEMTFKLEVIQKPYKPTSLVERVLSLLDGPASAG